MTEPGETDGMSIADHLEALYGHAGRGIVDGVLAHGHAFPPAILRRYADTGAHPAALDRDRLQALGVWVAEAELTGGTELARHHPEKLGRTLVRLCRHGGPSRAVALARPGRRER
jgi:2-phospho-L-lactate transferase/gluconeogenesis factor (CofD/UPF0052 family)